MNSDYACMEFIKIAKECRDTLVKDTLCESPDLYDALFSDFQDEIYKIKIELYEIKWLELHWKKISSTLERNETSLQERKEDISAFAKWYEDFVSEWNYTEFDTVIFEERINILKELITVNNKWETNLKNMTVSFKRSKKILTEKIDKLTKKGENAL
ncbi:MAG: hypothetical protein BHV87_02430 [Clostridiales bacterium 36_14]|jgi:hypothetical protein|nr:MAG: hypothetical protein BHV87_02430 [Clostridiales bacterium 36_14]